MELFAACTWSYADHIERSDKIIESFVKVMQDKGSNKIEITNGDEEPFENKMQSYVNEGEFATMYRKLLTAKEIGV